MSRPAVHVQFSCAVFGGFSCIVEDVSTVNEVLEKGVAKLHAALVSFWELRDQIPKRKFHIHDTKDEDVLKKETIFICSEGPGFA